MVNYRPFSATSVGASHIKEGKPCQDYSAAWSSEKMAIAAVADGHGGTPYFRSDRGSRFAVETVFECIKEFIARRRAAPSLSDCELGTLEKSVIAGWRRRVDADLESDPISAEAWAAKDGDMSETESYGTTLIAAAITDRYWFCIHIGDGKCVVFDRSGNDAQPVPWDEKCFLNITTSICDDDAVTLFRHFYSDELPAAVFLGSDGIDDCFPVMHNDTHLAGFYRRVHANFIAEGLRRGEQQLREIMPALTRKGSGDDVSIAGFLANTGKLLLC
jgi:hypothetical protein